jgi:diaminopimelate epimerase
VSLCVFKAPLQILLIVRAFVHNLKKMQVEFYKYQGKGNDFVMIDNRLETFQRRSHAGSLCNRRLGYGDTHL